MNWHANSIDTQDASEMILAMAKTSPKANLDALIKREDFEIDKGTDTDEPFQPVFCLPELESRKNTFRILRKPIFQRATSDWSPQQIADLVKNFVDRELIPAIIVWNSRSRLQFVMDGAHRLSALIAWVNDDYGAGTISQTEYGGIDRISKAHRAAHDLTKEIIGREVGHYKDLLKISETDNTGTAEDRTRATGMNSLPIVIQHYGKPDPRKAEAAFYRINQGGTPLTREEQEIIRTRRWPQSVAARTLWRVESGKHYLLGFQTDKTNQIKQIAQETHDLLLKPEPTNDEIPLVVPVMATLSTNASIGILDQFVHMANDLPDRKSDKHNFEPLSDSDPNIDKTGDTTIEYLKKAKRLAEVISSGESFSLGMHPLVYAYSKTCKFLPGAFFAQVKLVKHLHHENRLIQFADHRNAFEEFIVQHKLHLTKLTHDAGSNAKSAGPIFEYWKIVLDAISNKQDPIAAIQNSQFSLVLLMPDESEAQKNQKITKEASLAVRMRETLKNCPRCCICEARIYRKAWTEDHEIPKSEGGSGHSKNLKPAHGFCNTGVKEKRRHEEKAKARI